MWCGWWRVSWLLGLKTLAGGCAVLCCALQGWPIVAGGFVLCGGAARQPRVCVSKTSHPPTSLVLARVPAALLEPDDGGALLPPPPPPLPFFLACATCVYACRWSQFQCQAGVRPALHSNNRLTCRGVENAPLCGLLLLLLRLLLLGLLLLRPHDVGCSTRGASAGRGAAAEPVLLLLLCCRQLPWVAL